MNAPVCWLSRIEAYLTYRRSLGFQLTQAGGTLRQFARFADSRGEARLTIALAAQWARTSPRQTPITWARRIEVLRGFAQFCLRTDPTTEIPPSDLLGRAHRRLVPHIYTPAELVALLDAARTLSPRNGLRPLTCQTVLGLLAASGLRISEALTLKRADVDIHAGILTIREAKFHKSRGIPVHPTVTAALRAYAERRDQIVARTTCEAFFVFDRGRPLHQYDILYALQRLCRDLGLQPRGDYPHHRLHDMRHSFIVQSTLRTYERSQTPDHAVQALSTYVGHAKVTDTYWYFTGIPALMELTAARFQAYAQGEPL